MSRKQTNFAQLQQDFRRWLERHDRSEHTIRAYVSDLRQFRTWFEAQTSEVFTLQAVTEYDIQDWRAHLKAKWKPATVNRKLAALSTCFTWAQEALALEHDPTEHVQGLRQQQTAPQALSERDLKRLLRQVRIHGSPRDIALLELLAATGLRVSEVAALQRRDLELQPRSGWVTVREGKGRKRRRVPVHARARRALRAHFVARGILSPEETALAELATTIPVFLSRTGKRLSAYAIWYTVKKYARLAKLAGVTPHTFRHTVATRLVRNPEIDMVTAATFLGHTRLETTARYSRPNEDDLSAAATELI
ncbi:MAG: tyrosine-type recombinase/integrase [Chloroflexota bacterium]|nr:tyrosine-type recombinase/integrase [Chloroflexota bacterium]